MKKTIASFLFGAIPAATATWFVLDSDSRNTADDSLDSASFTVDLAATTALESERLTVLRATAIADDPDTLERQLLQALAAPFSAENNGEIAETFKRLAAIDLGRALQMTGSMDLDAGLVADIVRAIGEVDVDNGLSALAEIPTALHRRAAAIALFETLDYRPQELARIAAILPIPEQIDFQAEVLASLATGDPNAALTAALDLTAIDARNTAVERVGMAWVASDPAAAIGRTELLPRELQATYRNSVTIEWARTDVAAFLDYADSQPRLDDLVPAITHAMAVDPARAFEIAARHPPVRMGDDYARTQTVEREAFSGMSEQDPEGTLALLNSMPGSARKQDLMVAFAETYGRLQPTEALAWAQRVEPPNQALVSAVISRASLTNMDLALRWLIEIEPPTPGPFVMPGTAADNIGIYFGADPKRVDLANRLLAMPDEPNAAAALQRLMRVWTLTDPASAVDWMLSSDAASNPAMASNIARTLAGRNAEAAAELLDRMPPELRSTWVRDVAGPFANQNPGAAADWAWQFAGEPGYEQVLAQVVQQAAMGDPAATARLLPTLSQEARQNIAPRIAAAWAAQDLAGAARWAEGLDDEREQSIVVGQIGNAWANRDPIAAQRWASDLPSGEVRDMALAAVLNRLGRDAYVSTIDWQLLSAFESDLVRDRAVTQIVATMARRDPDEARSLIDRWITNPVTREQAELAIESVR